MENILIYAGLTFAALIALLMKIPKEWMLRMLGYELIVDIAFFALVKFLFFGTQGGMLVAFIAGLIFSLSLHSLTLLVGKARWLEVPCNHCGGHTRKWVYIPPKYTFTKPKTTT